MPPATIIYTAPIAQQSFACSGTLPNPSSCKTLLGFQLEVLLVTDLSTEKGLRSKFLRPSAPQRGAAGAAARDVAPEELAAAQQRGGSGEGGATGLSRRSECGVVVCV